MERWLILFASLLMVAPSQAEVPRGEMLAMACFACHGSDGEAFGDIPSFDTDTAEEIKIKLNDFKEDDPRVTIMTRIVRGYNASELEMIADYFGGKH